MLQSLNGKPPLLQMPLLHSYLEHGKGLAPPIRLRYFHLGNIRQCGRVVDFYCPLPSWKTEGDGFPPYACNLGAMERAQCEELQKRMHHA